MVTDEDFGIDPESFNKHAHIWKSYWPEIVPEETIPKENRYGLYARARCFLYDNYEYVLLHDRIIRIPKIETSAEGYDRSIIARSGFTNARRKIFLPIDHEWNGKWGHLGFRCSPREGLHPMDVYCEATVPLHWKIFTFFTTSPGGSSTVGRDFVIIDDNDTVMARVYVDEQLEYISDKLGTIYASHVDFPDTPTLFDPVKEQCQYLLDRKNGKRSTEFKAFK